MAHTLGFLGKKSSTGGGFECKETKVQAGVGVGVELVGSGVFISCESCLDRIVVELHGDWGALLMVQTQHMFPTLEITA